MPKKLYFGYFEAKPKRKIQMKLEIQIGKSRSVTFPCTEANLLDTLLGWEVKDAVAQSLTVVRIADATDSEAADLAEEWYDASTEHEEGNDWESIAERLATSAAQKLQAK